MKLWQPENPLGIYFAVVNTSSTATIVIGRPNQQIVLVSSSIIASNFVGIQWVSSPSSTALSGIQQVAQNGGYILPFNAGGWLETLIGESLVLTLAPSVQVGGMISYVWANQLGN